MTYSTLPGIQMHLRDGDIEEELSLGRTANRQSCVLEVDESNAISYQPRDGNPTVSKDEDEYDDKCNCSPLGR